MPSELEPPTAPPRKNRAPLLQVRGWTDVAMGGFIVLALAAFAVLAAGMLYLGLYEDTGDWSGDDISLADMAIWGAMAGIGATAFGLVPVVSVVQDPRLCGRTLLLRPCPRLQHPLSTERNGRCERPCPARYHTLAANAVAPDRGIASMVPVESASEIG